MSKNKVIHEQTIEAREFLGKHSPLLIRNGKKRTQLEQKYEGRRDQKLLVTISEITNDTGE